jgi:RNA polymerase sigma-70 factor (ECF subfamily)
MEISVRSRIRDGDPEAFRELFRQQSRAVYNHAFRLTGNWSSAEEVVSLTFLEAWRLRHKVEIDERPLRPWLLGIATNVVRNFTRASRRYAAAISRIPPHPEVPDFAPDVADRLDAVDHGRGALALLRQLRRAEREVFVLCAWSGLDASQAAEALGIPVGTAKSRLFRAKKKLRSLLAEKPEKNADSARTPESQTGQLLSNRENAARPNGLRQS